MKSSRYGLGFDALPKPSKTNRLNKDLEMRLLIANRSEIAVRIAQTAQRMGMEAIGVYASDERRPHHGRFFHELFELPGTGASAYLNIEAILQIATKASADLVHPGYGFLSENADAARSLIKAGFQWVGPSPSVISLMGNKPAAIALAKQLEIATVPGLSSTHDVQELAALLKNAQESFGRNARVLLKARAGGGGRGIRAVSEPEQFDLMINQASKEAKASFGEAGLYAEIEIPNVRHIEVQFIGDGQRSWILGDRDCSVQRRRQKFMELAPAPSLAEKTRAALHRATAKLAIESAYRGVGTAEFIVRGESWWFIEVNARLQVEHTVTEATTGLDLVELQLKLAIKDSAKLQFNCNKHDGIETSLSIALAPFPKLNSVHEELEPRFAPYHSIAVQCRVLAESYEPEPESHPQGWRLNPSAGKILAWKPPRGAGLRIDHAIENGDVVTTNFDSMIAKLIVSIPCASGDADWDRLLSKTRSALSDVEIEGLKTNIHWVVVVLTELLSKKETNPWVDLTTQWFDEWLTVQFSDTRASVPKHGGQVPGTKQKEDEKSIELSEQIQREPRQVQLEPRQIQQETRQIQGIYAPTDGLVLELITSGLRVRKGTEIGLIESMKMHHALEAALPLQVITWHVETGSQVREGQKIGEALAVESRSCVLDDSVSIPNDSQSNEGKHHRNASDQSQRTEALNEKGIPTKTKTKTKTEAEKETAREAGLMNDVLEHPRVSEWRYREAMTLDAARADAVTKRHASGMQTARENLAQLLDVGSLREIGSLVVAAQRKRRSLEDLIQNTPADGVITGIGTIHSDRFPKHCHVAVIAYDYTVLAGTQGKLNHDKQDRLIDICSRSNIPLVLLAEGGGGRPGDVDVITAGSLHIKTFSRFASLSGRVPLVGVVAGRCFAGNAVLLGCCDVIIATRQSNIGMAGPAMIEGGGLGRFSPEAIGPSDVQQANGVIDVIANDERDAISLAKRYLSYFQGIDKHWHCPNPQGLASALPLDRLRVYDMHQVIEGLVDVDSSLELRPNFAPNIITMLARIEGRPFGLLANNPMKLGGAIDANAADKAARFVQLCSAHGLAIVSLIDTPGNMVGPQAEEQALVRHCCRLFLAGAKVRVPWISLVIRKAYGLGAMAMAAGSLHDSLLSIAWPQAEFGGMGLEGAVRLGFKKELEAIQDEGERDLLFQARLNELMEHGKAVSAAMLFEIDAVIDPVKSRAWLISALEIALTNSQLSAKPSWVIDREGPNGRFVDAW